MAEYTGEGLEKTFHSSASTATAKNDRVKNNLDKNTA